MNILFYIPTVLIGGIRTVTEILSHEFRIRGHNVFWLVHHSEYGDNRDFPKNENCIYLPSNELMTAENVLFYNTYIKEKKIDVVINQHALYEGVQLIDTAKDTDTTIISVLHSNPIQNYGWLFKDIISLKNSSSIEKIKRICRIILYPYIKKSARDVIYKQLSLLKNGRSHIVVLSPKYISTIKQWMPDIDSVSAIANPNVYLKVNHQPKEKIALFVGRLDNRSKKIQYLLKIWQTISKKNRCWKLVIVGDGPDEATLRRQAQGISNIEFKGYQNPKSYYDRASIFCMTSIFEGFPMVLTEAMQHGCVPIVYDTYPALSDIISDGVDGEIVKPFNKSEYVHKLLNLMNDDSYREKLSKAAERNIARYNADKIAEEWLALINKLKTQRIHY